MGKIGRFHPFIPYIVLLRTQKTLYIVIYPFVTALKSLARKGVSVQIRLLAPDENNTNQDGKSRFVLFFANNLFGNVIRFE